MSPDSSPDPSDLTRAINDLTPTEYPEEVQLEIQGELRRLAEMHMAREASGHTLQCTALLNEAYLWFLSDADGGRHYPSRGHFYALASRIMRNVLADHARRKGRRKRGGDWSRVTLMLATVPGESAGDDQNPTADLLDLSEALEELEALRPDLAEVVDLRFFGGLDLATMAEVLGRSTRTVERRLRMATAWLVDRLDAGDPEGQ